MRAVAALCLLAGCDVMFKLENVDPPIDATPCGSPDEDGDCIADAVDNCPGISNAQQLALGEVDTPGGAGDACDPEPARAGDYVQLFNGFNDPVADQTEWNNKFGADWVFADGRVEQRSNQTWGYLRHFEVDDDPDLTIEAMFVYLGMAPDAIDARMGIWIDMPSEGYSGESCWVSPTSMRVLAQENPDAAMNNTVGASIPALPIGAKVILRMRRDRVAEEVHCSAIIDGSTVDIEVLRSSAPWVMTGPVTIQGRFLQADVEYVTFYSR